MLRAHKYPPIHQTIKCPKIQALSLRGVSVQMKGIPSSDNIIFTLLSHMQPVNQYAPILWDVFIIIRAATGDYFRYWSNCRSFSWLIDSCLVSKMSENCETCCSALVKAHENVLKCLVFYTNHWTLSSTLTRFSWKMTHKDESVTLIVGNWFYNQVLLDLSLQL